MTLADKLTFVVSVNNREILQRNLLVSPMLAPPHRHEVLIQEGFRSAAAAYNAALDRSQNDLVVFTHQDTIFPSTWFDELKSSIEKLEQAGAPWGVLGCYGETQDRQDKGYIYSPDMGTIGAPFALPESVQTLDEFVLIFKKSSGLRFDDALPHFHFYGTDICLSAQKRGLGCFAIPAFCIHNTEYLPTLPPEFYQCYRHIKRKWREFLPIQTSCITVSRFDSYLYRKRTRDFYSSLMRRDALSATRVSDGRQLLATLERARLNASNGKLENWPALTRAYS